MTLSSSDHPLIPRPPATAAALRAAVARIAPAALPAFTGELDRAADRALLGADPAPLRRFTAQWALYVEIQRHPRLAARLREAEQIAATGEEPEARQAAAEAGRVLDEARATLVASESPGAD
ncbi:hypothetical protein [Streptomyces sp. NPDC046887]|uniref:hypothetical protein n=1 Tax=Streptomyces sp. NPDC046887 TaxID=3155472 RepID=UPI003405A170